MSDKNKASAFYIYSNPSMPNMIKFGFTESLDTVEKRSKELYTTGVPTPFFCEYASTVDNAPRVEAVLQRAFQDYRVNPDREFFYLESKIVIDIIKEIDNTYRTNNNLTNNEHDNLSDPCVEMNLNEGEIIYFHHNPDIQAEVVDENFVLINGEFISLVNLTYRLTKTTQSPLSFWEFDHQLLSSLIKVNN